MKKMLIALLCAILTCGCACAEPPSDPLPTPSPETPSLASAGSMTGTLNGAPLTLEFDPDPQFSIYQDGYVQASFYAYGEGDLLYELYMTFPQTVLSGDVITPESSLLSGQVSSGLMLFVSDTDSDVCSAAGQYLSGPYPAGSSYSMSFSDVTVSGTSYTFTGSVDAKLAVVDILYNPTSEINELSAAFSFTMELGSASAAPRTEPSAPGATEPPSNERSAPDDIPGIEPTTAPAEQRPPLPPATLITPANAQKI